MPRRRYKSDGERIPLPCRGCGGPKPKGQGRKYCENCTPACKAARAKSPCARCGGEKPDGQGHRYCDDCAAKPKDRRQCQHCEQRLLVPEQIGPRAKFCASCLRQRRRDYAKRHYAANSEKVKAHVAEYREANREKVNAYKKRHYQENRERIRKQQNERAQLPEMKAAARERSRRWYEENRERARAASNAYRKAHAAERRAANRRWYLKQRSNPKLWQRRLETERLSARLRAERKGRPMRPLTAEQYRERYGTGFGLTALVPVDPLKPLLERECEEKGVPASYIANTLGMRQQTIARILDGSASRVSLVTADKLCVHLGVPMGLLYPEAA